MGVVQSELSRDMGPDLDRRATEARFQPSAQPSLLCLRHTGLTTLPAVEGKRIPAILLVALIPPRDGVIIQMKAIRNLLAGFAVVKQQDRICPAGNTVVFALTANASLKLGAVC